MQGRERVAAVEQNDRRKRKEHRVYRLGNEQGGHTFDVIDNLASLVDDVRHSRKIRIEQHEVGNIFCRVASRRHRDPAVRLFQSEHIVYAVSRHRDRVSSALHGRDQLFFLRWSDASEHIIFFCGSFKRFLRCERRRVHRFIILDARPLGNRACCYRAVARYDFDCDLLLLKKAQRLFRVRPYAV